MGKEREMYKVLTGKPEEEIRMGLGEIGWGVWIVLYWLRIGAGGEL
jgi:hypothetical protein